MSSFIGRERELPEVKRTLSTIWLLTSTEAGGSGNTRLALEAAWDLFRDLGDVRSVAICLIALGLILLSQGDSEGAAVLFEESLLLKEPLNKTAILFGMVGMAGVAALRGQPTRTAKLFGALETLREAMGLSRTPLSLALYGSEGWLTTARAGLEEAAFEAGWSEGQAMTPEEAIEYALSKEEEHEPPTPVPVPDQEQLPPDERAQRLTSREREVALLVARELTNRQIAKELSISERTVENHVAKILKKLRLRSRAQISSLGL
jgi:DNA-binding CsgD family transcriptional regulator